MNKVLKKIYIAGPMTGYKKFNFPQFDYWRDRWAAKGYQVFSPADNDRRLLGKEIDWLPSWGDQEGDWKKWAIQDAPGLRKMLGDDLNWIAQEADAIFMMNGWEQSSGAFAEWALARYLRIDIRYEDTI